MTAYGYIRQSRRADLDVAMSPDQQRQDIATLARRDGVEVATVFEDLGRSGGKGKERHRLGYRELLAAIESGDASVVYAKSLTRLGRSRNELLRVLDLAEDHGCRIVTMKEGAMDPTTPIGNAQFGMMAVFAQLERDFAVERAKDNVASRRARGEKMGRRTYGTADGEDPAVIVDAFREAGSYNGAAAELNRRGLRSMLGRDWTPTSVRILVEREAPELVPLRGRSGSRSSASFVLNGLLRCPCGAFLTGTTSHGGKYVRYHCHRAAHIAGHGRPSSVAEANVLPWIKAEAARLQAPADVEADGAEDQRAALEAKRARIIDMAADGTIDKADRDRRLEAVADELDQLTATARVLDVPALDWTWPPATVNGVLRALWSHVELDADLRPVRAAWTVPEWRSEA